MESVKYIRGSQTYSIESCKQGKIRMHDGDGFTETPWIAEDPNGKDSVLLNHALAFTPFESWGAVIPARGSFNFIPMMEKGELTLHPEAFDEYMKHNIIDAEGNYIKKFEEEENAEESTEPAGDKQD